MHLAGAGPFRHDKPVGFAVVPLAVVHYAQTVADLVRYDEGRFEIGSLIDGATVVPLAHSANPSEAKHTGVVFTRCCLVQIKTLPEIDK